MIIVLREDTEGRKSSVHPLLPTRAIVDTPRPLAEMPLYFQVWHRRIHQPANAPEQGGATLAAPLRDALSSAPIRAQLPLSIPHTEDALPSA